MEKALSVPPPVREMGNLCVTIMVASGAAVRHTVHGEGMSGKLIKDCNNNKKNMEIGLLALCTCGKHISTVRHFFDCLC